VRPETSRLRGRGHSGGKGGGIRFFTKGKWDSASYFQGVTAGLRIAGLRKASAERPHTIDGAPPRYEERVRNSAPPYANDSSWTSSSASDDPLRLRREDTSNGHVAANKGHSIGVLGLITMLGSSICRASARSVTQRLCISVEERDWLQRALPGHHNSDLGERQPEH
jgi:hypothetical protein